MSADQPGEGGRRMAEEHAGTLHRPREQEATLPPATGDVRDVSTSSAARDGANDPREPSADEPQASVRRRATGQAPRAAAQEAAASQTRGEAAASTTAPGAPQQAGSPQPPVDQAPPATSTTARSALQQEAGAPETRLGEAPRAASRTRPGASQAAHASGPGLGETPDPQLEEAPASDPAGVAALGPDDVAGGSTSSALSVLRRGLADATELRRALPVATLLALVAGGGRVVVPVLVQQVLDRWIVGPAKGRAAPEIGLWAPALVAIVAVVVTGWAQAVSQRRLLSAAEASLASLRVRAFRHVHRLSLADLAEEQRGALVARVTSDPETISQFLAWGGLMWIVNGALMLVTAIVMVVYDWRLALVAILTVAPLALLLRVVQRRLVAAYDALRARVSDTLSALAEAISGFHVIRAAGAEADAAERVDSAVRAQRRADMRAGTIGALLFPCGDAFAVLTTAAVLGVGIALGPGRGLSSGTVVAFAFLVGLFLQPVAEFTEILDQTQMAVAGWRKILDLVDTREAVRDPDPDIAVPLPAGGALAVRVDHVSFAYPTGGRVLHDISFELRPGTRAALVGATGSGKSTLGKLLARMADPDEGTVEVGGVDLRLAEPASLRRNLLVVPQEVFLFDGTVGDNVRFARPGAGDDDVRRAFADLGLDDWVEALPSGLETPVGDRGEHLSVGERQLVALARAGLAAPGVLVLDEATSALDPATEVRVGRALERLSAGRTSITVAHRLATAARADLVLVLEHGHLVEVGNHDELVARGGTYARLYERWLEVAAVA